MNVSGDTILNNLNVLGNITGLSIYNLSMVSSQDISLGYGSLSSNIIGGNYNIALSENSLQSNTTGADNVALGQNSLQLNTTGEGNIALGHN